MTDVERELREMFLRREGDIRDAWHAPPRDVIRRGRRRQAVTALMAALTVVAVAVGGLLVLRAALPPAPTMPGDDSSDSGLLPGERVVIASGESFGVPWTLVAYESLDGLCVDLEVSSGSAGGCGFDESADLGLSIGSVGVEGRGLLTFVHGPVSREIAEVRVELGDGRVMSATIYPAPEALDVPFDFYVLPLGLLGSGAEDLTLRVVALDEQGEVVASDRVHYRRDPSDAFFEALDAYGNVVGYVSPSEDGVENLWTPPAEAAGSDRIRAIAQMSLEHILLPKVQHWWERRPSADANDDAFVEWWADYPINRDVPDV